MTYNNSKLKALINNPKLNPYLRGLAEEIVNDIKLSMEEVSPGRDYGDHEASLPGDPPNVDQGFLVSSIDWDEISELKMVVFDGEPYGIELELGTATVEARPFMRPQFTFWKQYIGRDMKEQGVIS